MDDRLKLIGQLKFIRDYECKTNAEIRAMNDAITALSEEPQERKGRWIPVDSYTAFGGDEATWYAHGNPIAFYYCSKCKEQAYADENGDSLLTNFCPNCGADMREVDNEQT